MPPKPIYDKTGLNLEAIKWAIRALSERQDDFRKARLYYCGDHPLHFVTDKFRSAFSASLGKMKANMMPPFVDIPANRLVVDKFTPKGRGLAPELAQVLTEDGEEVWEVNRMDTRAFDVMKEALLCGESFMIVWPDVDPAGNVTPIFYPQAAGSCAVQYHPERPGFVVRGAKFWQEGKRIRLNIYTSASIEKYISAAEATCLPDSASAFRRFISRDAESGRPSEPWPLPNKYGKCPVFHFANGRDRKSELADIYDSQNALNLTLCNLLVSMEFFSYPQRYALGFDPTKTAEEGQVAEWRAAMDRVWFHWDKEVEMGQFDPSDPSAFLNVMREFRAMMSEIKGVPKHYLTMEGTPPSGIALAILERRLNDHNTRSQTAWGNVWADAMLFALKTMGKISEGQTVRLECEWRDSTPRDPKVEAETIEILQRAGLSRRGAMRELGKSDAEIQQNEDERADEAAKAGDLMGGLFNQGAV